MIFKKMHTMKAIFAFNLSVLKKFTVNSMKRTVYLVLAYIFVANCRPKDNPIPDGVSTFISSSQFKDKLGAGFAPRSLAFDRAGNLYVSSYYQIVKITSSGDISLFAGSDPGYKNGLASDAKFNGIQGMTFDKNGNLYIGEQKNNCIRKIDNKGYVSLFAGRPNWVFSPGADGPVDGPDSLAHFISPTALTVDTTDNILETESGFISKFSADATRKISPNGVVKTIAGTVGGYSFGIFSDQPDYFQNPSGLAMGLQDTMFVSDSYNAVIRIVFPNGNIKSLAGNGQRTAFDGPSKQASFQQPTALVYYKQIGLLIADISRVRLLSPNGYVSTLTGSGEASYQDGSLKEAKFGQISDMALDQKKILYIVDGSNMCIRRIRLPL